MDDRKITRRTVLAAPLALAGATLGAPALAQARYPSKSVTLLVGFPPGGSTDFVARVLAQKLSETLGQPVVIENRGGANGLLAANALGEAPPDGHTLLLTTMAMTTNPYLYKRSTRDPVKDYTSIAMVADLPNVIVVHPSVPAKDLSELLALARARAAEGNLITVATTGTAAAGHLACVLLQRAANVRFEFIEYKGSGPALTDVLAGHVNMSLPSVVAALPHIKTGKLRAIAVTGSKRAALLPDVPSIPQAGIKEVSAGSGWAGLIGPAGMPRDVVQRLSTEVEKIMKMPDVHERFVSNGADPMYMNHPAMTAFVGKDYKFWGDLIKAANIKAAE